MRRVGERANAAPEQKGAGGAVFGFELRVFSDLHTSVEWLVVNPEGLRL
jgi:hypothetical protein